MYFLIISYQTALHQIESLYFKLNRQKCSNRNLIQIATGINPPPTSVPNTAATANIQKNDTGQEK